MVGRQALPQRAGPSADQRDRLSTQVTSGSLRYTPGAMLLGGGDDGEGAFAWDDRPEAPPRGGADTLWFNISYERVGDVPRYDRGSDVPLHQPSRKRAAADGPLAGEAARGAGRPIKRSRSAGRCVRRGRPHGGRDTAVRVDRLEQLEPAGALGGAGGLAQRRAAGSAQPGGRVAPAAGGPGG